MEERIMWDAGQIVGEEKIIQGTKYLILAIDRENYGDACKLSLNKVVAQYEDREP